MTQGGRGKEVSPARESRMVDVQTTVQVLGLTLLDVKGLSDASPIASFLLPDCGSLPADLVLVRPGVNCNPVLGIILLHCRPVFT